MKDNIKNFKEASDAILKNIYVTEELKRKTLEKCNQKKEFKIKPIFAAVFSAALIVSFGTYAYLFHEPAVIDKPIAKSISEEYKNSKVGEDKTQKAAESENGNVNAPVTAPLDDENNAKKSEPVPEKKNTEVAMEKPINIPQAKSTDTINENAEIVSQGKADPAKANEEVPQKGADVSNSKIAGGEGDGSSSNNNGSNGNGNSNSAVAVLMVPSMAAVPETVTAEKAEQFFGSKILVPSDIPEGFKLDNISIPDDKQKCIKLKYSSDTASFEIVESKNLSKLQGTENISIGSNTAYVNSVKDEGTNTTTISITWIKDDIQYSMSGTLPKDSMIKIAQSIN